MTRGQRAAQIWPLLSLCAVHRQTLTYDMLAKLIGGFTPGLGQLLEPIQSHCILQDWPPLSVLVVGNKSGTPGEGFIAAADVPAAQAEVFSFPWLEKAKPDEHVLEEACRKLPSNGRSLQELLSERNRLAQKP